jgi:copper chaperone
MMREVISLSNVKCGGCASAIEKALAKVSGVAQATVDVQTGVVTIEGETLNRTALTQQLAVLGYPEKTV